MQRIDRASLIVLVAVLTTVAVRSSEAIQCYDCCSLNSVHCKEPFSGVGVGICQGQSCIKTEVMALGKSWVLRRCNNRPFIGEIIAGAKILNIGANAQICSTDFCNGQVSVTQSISHTVPIPRTPEPTYAESNAVAPPVNSKHYQDSPSVIPASSSISHQQQRTGAYALLATSAAVVLLAKLQG